MPDEISIALASLPLYNINFFCSYLSATKSAAFVVSVLNNPFHPNIIPVDEFCGLKSAGSTFSLNSILLKKQGTPDIQLGTFLKW